MKSEVFSSAPQHEIEPFGVRSQDNFALQHDCVRLNRHAATPSWETQFQKTIEQNQISATFCDNTAFADASTPMVIGPKIRQGDGGQRRFVSSLLGSSRPVRAADVGCVVACGGMAADAFSRRSRRSWLASPVMGRRQGLIS
jgi:hypothetical protein